MYISQKLQPIKGNTFEITVGVGGNLLKNKIIPHSGLLK